MFPEKKGKKGMVHSSFVGSHKKIIIIMNKHNIIYQCAYTYLQRANAQGTSMVPSPDRGRTLLPFVYTNVSTVRPSETFCLAS